MYLKNEAIDSGLVPMCLMDLWYIGSKLENEIFYGRKQYYTRLFLMNKTLLDQTIKVGNHISIKTGPKKYITDCLL